MYTVKCYSTTKKNETCHCRKIDGSGGHSVGLINKINTDPYYMFFLIHRSLKIEVDKGDQAGTVDQGRLYLINACCVPVLKYHTELH
jgi:hypothetical protein